MVQLPPYYSKKVIFLREIVDDFLPFGSRFFTCGNSGFIYDLNLIFKSARKVPLQGYRADPWYVKITQVKHELYEYNGENNSFSCYTNLSMLTGTNNKIKKASPQT